MNSTGRASAADSRVLHKPLPRKLIKPMYTQPASRFLTPACASLARAHASPAVPPYHFMPPHPVFSYVTSRLFRPQIPSPNLLLAQTMARITPQKRPRASVTPLGNAESPSVASRAASRSVQLPPISKMEVSPSYISSSDEVSLDPNTESVAKSTSISASSATFRNTSGPSRSKKSIDCTSISEDNVEQKEQSSHPVSSSAIASIGPPAAVELAGSASSKRIAEAHLACFRKATVLEQRAKISSEKPRSEPPKKKKKSSLPDKVNQRKKRDRAHMNCPSCTCDRGYAYPPVHADCPICEREHRSPYSAVRHFGVHDRRFSCKLCPHVASRIEDLRAHSRKSHMVRNLFVNLREYSKLKFAGHSFSRIFEPTPPPHTPPTLDIFWV